MAEFQPGMFDDEIPAFQGGRRRDPPPEPPAATDDGDDDFGICPHCGAKMVEYRSTFNEGKAVFLCRLYQTGGPTKTDDLGLTYSQRTNSHKLRYWGLAAPHLNEESKIKRGWWQITDRGRAFVEGRIKIPETAVTFRNEVIRFEGDEISIDEAAKGWDYYADFVQQIRDQIR